MFSERFCAGWEVINKIKVKKILKEMKSCAQGHYFKLNNQLL